MDLNHQQAYVLSSLGFDEAWLRQCLAQALPAGQDLCGLLVQGGQLTQAQARHVRGTASQIKPSHQAPGHQEDLLRTMASSATHTNAVTASSSDVMNVASVSHQTALTEIRSRSTESLKTALFADPRFCPHADLVFERVELLGEGGMGSVFRIRDQRLGREAAMKVLNIHSTGPELHTRFERETRITACLDHPAIPPVYEAGTNVKGEPYMLMRVIQGQTLTAHIDSYHEQDCPATQERSLLEVLVRAAEAVAYAHSQRIVHRDIKPGNIMVGEFGEVMVVDWGLARELEAASDLDTSNLGLSQAELDEAGLTVAGTIIGTPGYMPPEQAEGRPVGEQADVFALGAVLMAILTNEPPVEGKDNLKRIINTVRGRLRSPRDLKPSVPAALQALAKKALASDRRERMGTAQEFVSELKRYLNDEELKVHRSSLLERVQRSLRRRPFLAIGSLLLGLALLLLSLVLQQTAFMASSQASKQAHSQDFQALSQQVQAVLESEGKDQRKAIDELLRLSQRDPAYMYLIGKQFLASGHRGPALEMLKELIKLPGASSKALLDLHVLITQTEGLPVVAETAPLSRLIATAENAEKQGQTLGLSSLTALVIKDLNKEQWSSARARCQRLLEQHPESSFGYFLRAKLQLRDSKERCREDLIQCLSTRPNFAPAYLMLGFLEKTLGRNDEARIQFERCHALNPENNEVAVLLARLRHSPNWSTALKAVAPKLEALRRSLAKAPKSLKPWRQRQMVRALIEHAELAFFDQKYEAALADLKRCDELSPKDLRVALSRVHIYLMQGQLGQADQALEQARELEPNPFQLNLAEGKLRQRQGDLANALSAYERALDRNPQSATVLVLAANVQRLRGDLVDAQRRYRKAVELEPKNFEALFQLALIDIKQNRVQDALKYLEEAAKRGAEPHTVAFHRSQCFFALKKFGEALKAISEALRQRPREAQYWATRAQLRQLLEQDPLLAASDYCQALNLMPSRADWWQQRANCWARLGRELLEFSDLRQACVLSPTVEFIKVLITARERRKQLTELEQDFTMMLKKRPKAGLFYLYRGRVRQSLGRSEEAKLDMVRSRRLLSTPQNLPGTGRSH